MLLDKRKNLLKNLLIAATLGVANGNIDDGGKLVKGLQALESRSALLVEIRDHAALLAGTENRELLKSPAEELIRIIQEFAGNDHALAGWLILSLVGEVRHIADGADALEGTLHRGARGGGSGGQDRQAKLRVAKLAQGEVPGQERRRISIVGVVLNLLEDVSTVSAANIDLKGSEGHPRILMGEEEGQDIEDGVLGVHNLLDDVQAGLTVIPASLTVARLDNRGAKNVLHLSGSLLERGQGALDQDLAGLEGDLGSLTRLELGKLAKDGAKVLADIADIRLVGAVLVQNGENERVLGGNSAMGENGLGDLLDVLLVLVTQLEDDLLVLQTTAGEEALDLDVRSKEITDDIELMDLLALGVLVDDSSERRESGLQQLSVRLGDEVLVQELLEDLAEIAGRELGGARRSLLEDLSELGIELLGHASMKGRELSGELAVGELGITKNLNQVLQCLLHDDLVIVTHEDVLESVIEKTELLSGLLTHDNRSTELGKLAEERLSLLDTARIIESKDTEDVTGLEGSSGLLDELNDTVLLGNQRHIHLHDLNLSEGLTGADVLAVLDGVLDELTGRGGAQLSGIVLLLEQTGLAIDRHAGSSNLFLPVDVVTATVEKDEESTVAQSTDADGALGAVDEEMVAISARPGDSELVAVTLVNEVNGEDSPENILGGDLTLLETGAVLGHAGFTGNVGLGDGTANDGQDGIGTLSSELVGDELIEPAGSDGVVLESLSLQKLDEVFDGGTEVTANAQFLEGDNHVLARSGTVLTISENVTELGVGETVNTTGGTDGEVTPDVGARTEVEIVQHTVGGLEALTRILRGDTAGSGMALGGGPALGLFRLGVLELEVDLGGGLGVDSVEKSDVADAVEGNTHGNLELSSRKVDTTDHFRGRMLDLQTGVQLKEVELVIGVRVEVLDGTGRDVTDETTKTDSSILHGLKGSGLGDGYGGLFDNLLVSALNRAISAEERDVVAILIGKKLDLQMPGAVGELHDEDGRAGNFASGSIVKRLEVVLAEDLADTLATTTLGGLDHYWETNLPGLLETLLPRVDTALEVNVIGNRNNAVVVDRDLVDTGTRPRDTRNVGVLGDNRRGNLVTERAHGRTRGTDEDDLLGGSRKGLGKLGVLGGVAPIRSQYHPINARSTTLFYSPTSPHSVDIHTLGNINDKLDIGVVVVICAAGDFDVVISHPDVVGIGLQIFGGGHNGELDGALVAECLVGPFPY